MGKPTYRPRNKRRIRKHGFRASPFPRGRQTLDFLEHNLIQIEVIGKCGQVAPLLPDDLRGGVLHDPWAVRPRLLIRSDKVLERLTDGPNTRVTFARSAEELHNFGRENWRIQ